MYSGSRMYHIVPRISLIVSEYRCRNPSQRSQICDPKYLSRCTKTDLMKDNFHTIRWKEYTIFKPCVCFVPCGQRPSFIQTYHIHSTKSVSNRAPRYTGICASGDIPPLILSISSRYTSGQLRAPKASPLVKKPQGTRGAPQERWWGCFGGRNLIGRVTQCRRMIPGQCTHLVVVLVQCTTEEKNWSAAKRWQA